MKLLSIGWFLTPPAGIFYSLCAGGLQESAALPSTVLLAVNMAMWVLADARKRQRTLPYDFGSFIFCAWPVLVPVYLFSTRGWRAFAPAGWFLLLHVAAVAVSVIPWLLASAG